MNNRRHIIESQQFSPEIIMKFLQYVKQFEERKHRDVLAGLIIATLFYEPSSRTRLSSESAILRMGGQYIGTENAREFSSAAKGETIEDTIRVIGSYVDAIVLRHHEVGSAKRAAAVSPVPIINAGDGVGQHPTQALTDAYTIYENFGRLDNLTIQFIGDLANGRTARSLTYLLAKFPNNRLIFVSPRILKMRDDILDYLKKHGVEYVETENIRYDVDVNYITRIQKERFGDNMDDFNSVFGKYIIDKQLTEDMLDSTIIMHPLPRINEITTEVDGDHRAVYFKQAENGMYVRMALLDQIFSEAPFLFS